MVRIVVVNAMLYLGIMSYALAMSGNFPDSKLRIEDKSYITMLPLVSDPTKIRRISLDGCRLTEIPETIALYANTEELYCESNQIQTISPDLGQLRNLAEINLEHNCIEFFYVPDGSLLNLTFLKLSNNRFKNFPPCILGFANLKTLLIGMNEITDIPREIAQLHALEIFSIFDNCLTTIPKEVADLPELYELDVSENQLAQVPPLPKSLKILLARDNQITCFSADIVLETLDLRGNPLEEVGQKSKKDKENLRPKLYKAATKFTPTPPAPSSTKKRKILRNADTPVKKRLFTQRDVNLANETLTSSEVKPKMATDEKLCVD